MSPALKLILGLAAVAGVGWVHHGLLGFGETYIGSVESEARKVVAATNVPRVEVRMQRDPLGRLATLSGKADAFQREGQGEMKGISDRVRDVPGVSDIRWTDQPAKSAIPLFAELLVQLLIAYLVGLGLAWLLWGRPKRKGFY
jgi:hypothetical protein